MAEETTATERVNPYAGMSVEQIAAARKEKRAAYETNRQSRMDELRRQREATALQNALARAATNPKYNFTQRPEGKIDEAKGVIQYYGWNGGKTTGSWVLREAPLTAKNLEKYNSRVPAMEYAVRDVKSIPLPLKDIMGKPQAPGGFTVGKDGQIITRGNVSPDLLTVKSDYEKSTLEGKRVEREQIALQRALARAGTNPIYNFMSRPAGKVTDDTIYFYSWVGSKDSGQWYLYEAKNNPDNLEIYESRVKAMEYNQPFTYRDVLIPKQNIFGEYQTNTIVTKQARRIQWYNIMEMLWTAEEILTPLR